MKSGRTHKPPRGRPACHLPQRHILLTGYEQEKNKKAKSNKEEKATCAQGACFAYKETRGRQESARGQEEREGTEGAEKESGFRIRLDEKRRGRQAAK